MAPGSVADSEDEKAIWRRGHLSDICNMKMDQATRRSRGTLQPDRTVGMKTSGLQNLQPGMEWRPVAGARGLWRPVEREDIEEVSSKQNMQGFVVLATARRPHLSL